MEFNKSELKKTYRKGLLIKNIILLVLLFLVILAFIFGIAIGSSYIPFFDVCRGLFVGGTDPTSIIVRNVRLPRVLTAIVAGVALAAAGCVMQTVLRNDLASPSTIGISNASVFGANLAIIVFNVGTAEVVQGSIQLSNPYLVAAFSFIFSMLATLFILFLSRVKHFSTSSIVLAGAAVSAMCGAGTTILQFYADELTLASAVFWSFGDLGRVSILKPEFYILLTVTVIALIYFMFNVWNYNAIASGHDIARSLGVKVERVSIISLLFASLVTSVAVAFLGIIGFVGLICIHIVKIFIKDDFRYLLPASCLFGAFLLLVGDIISRTISPRSYLPVGAVTSMLGGPIFIYLLLVRKEER